MRKLCPTPQDDISQRWRRVSVCRWQRTCAAYLIIWCHFPITNGIQNGNGNRSYVYRERKQPKIHGEMAFENLSFVQDCDWAIHVHWHRIYMEPMDLCWFTFRLCDGGGCKGSVTTFLSIQVHFSPMWRWWVWRLSHLFSFIPKLSTIFHLHPYTLTFPSL